MKNKLENTKNIQLNVNRDDPELNDFLHCWDEFTTRPNKIIIHNTYSTKLFNDILSKFTIDKNLISEFIPTEEDYIINDKIFAKLDDKIYCSYIVVDRKSENSIINEIIFWYADEKTLPKVQEIIEELNDCIVDFCEDETWLNTISFGSNGVVEIEPIIIPESDFDSFDMYYSENTNKDIKKLIKDIKRSNKGLSILYGDKGTGKTSIINYLSNKLDRIVIFIPNNIIEHTINSSDFRKFLKRYYKPIIIIDDCEMLMNEAFTKSNHFVNNLMQMVDGFLSDLIEVNIITIFNVTSSNEIDHTLLNCNNLIKVIKFDKLSQAESTELSNTLGFKKKYKNKMRVIDIIKNNDPEDNLEIGLH